MVNTDLKVKNGREQSSEICGSIQITYNEIKMESSGKSHEPDISIDLSAIIFDVSQLKGISNCTC